MTNKIAIAATDEEISNCYSVMSELRPHIKREEFVPRVKKLSKITGLQIAYLQQEGEVKAVAGFRTGEWLAADGKYLEIEDLVTKSGERSNGFGSELFDWLVNFAEENNCTHLRLVSNVARVDAHRFYERKGMAHIANYFSMNLELG